MTRIPAPGSPHVVAVVQAGGQGSRMDVLTRERAKPALPYAGTYRLVDLALSLATSAGIGDVWVSVQFMASTLDEHLQHGRPWDLDRVRGGYRRMVPESGGHTGFAGSNTEDLLGMAVELDREDPDLVVTMSADQVLLCDLGRVLADHWASGAEATVLALEVDGATARHKAVLTVDGDRLLEVAEKPEETGARELISAEVLVMSWPVLREVLQEVRAASPGGGEDDEEHGPGDLPEEVLPRLAARGRTRVARVEGHWRDMGRPSSYLQEHRELTTRSEEVLASPVVPIRGHQPSRPPARVATGAEVSDSLLAAGSLVRGAVRGSVIGPGCVVHPGAEVVDSILFDAVEVLPGARVVSAIVDDRCRIGRGAVVGARAADEPADEEIALLGADSTVADGARVEAGARLEPGTSAD